MIDSGWPTDEDIMATLYAVQAAIGEASGAIYEDQYTWGTTLGRVGSLYPSIEVVVHAMEHRLGRLAAA